jgi:murein L,D-transpeptidase YcbB/YkuD
MLFTFHVPTLARNLALGAASLVATAAIVQADSFVFRQSLAEAVAGDRTLAAFYRERGHATIWTGDDDGARRAALLRVLGEAPDHGLPEGRYDVEALIDALRSVESEAERAGIEARMTRVFLRYARDIATGVLTPTEVNPEMVRSVNRKAPEDTLTGFVGAEPMAFLRALPPQSAEYARLMRERHRLLDLIASGGWGPAAPEGRYELGDTGPGVIALRNRLIAMGYLPRTAEPAFDARLQAAVIAFQSDHGLLTDGVVGPGTLRALNASPEDRLRAVLVAMERERWMNFDRGDRHIWVNLADFSASIIDDGKITFQTRAVVGKNAKDRRSPEFSDEMTHMVINPSWFVPRSITTKEYLPELQRDPNAVDHLDVVDRQGRILDRAAIDFTQFTQATFPFSIRQSPGPGNALGKVKFMFPNRWNIYLHDTPQKSLFSREVRDFSHGCIRLNDPFDFAYRLLARQTDNPEGYFHRILNTGRETRVNLEQPVQVHLVYRTAIMPARGKAQYRADIYGRDARIFDALLRAGLALPAAQS